MRAGEESSEQLSLAKDRFREASLAHERGAHAEAARLFEEANRLAPRAQALFNAGVAWQAADEPARAANAFEYALMQGGLEEPNQSQAHERLNVLKRALAYLSVPEPLAGQVSVGHLERASIPVRTHLLPGTYLVRIQYPDGASRSKKLDLAAGQTQTLMLPAQPTRVPTSAGKRPGVSDSSAKATPTLTPAPKAALEATPEESPRTSATATTWGWIGVGTGAVLTGTAIVLGLQFLDANQSWDDSGNRALDQQKRASKLRLWTNVAWAGAAVSGGAGVWLLASPRLEF